MAGTGGGGIADEWREEGWVAWDEDGTEALEVGGCDLKS